MSVTRYTIYYNERERGMYVTESQDGKYCLHSDYAALLARHNALVEAVAKYCDEVDKIDNEYPSTIAELDVYQSARAEVDRLLGES